MHSVTFLPCWFQAVKMYSATVSPDQENCLHVWIANDSEQETVLLCSIKARGSKHSFH